MMKILNDFDELIADLETAMKKEKNDEYRNFIRTIKENIALWRTKYDYFTSAVDKKQFK